MNLTVTILASTVTAAVVTAVFGLLGQKLERDARSRETIFTQSVELAKAIRETPNLTYLILTKRPHRILECLPRIGAVVIPMFGWAPALGATLLCGAWTRCEKFQLACTSSARNLCWKTSAGNCNLDGIHWLITGGESGSGPHSEFVYSEKNWRLYFDPNKSGNGRRTMKIEWARKLLDMSRAAKIPFYFKQVTSSQQHANMSALGQVYREYPAPPTGRIWLPDDDETKAKLKLASPISWTHWPWNPWKGCIKVGPECMFCYIDRPSCGGGMFNIIEETHSLNNPYKWAKQITGMSLGASK